MTREEAIEILSGFGIINRYCSEDAEALDMAIKALEQEPDTWSLEDAREDFVDDVYNTLDFLPTNNEANQIIDSFDRVTSDIKQQPCEDCISRKEVNVLVDELARAISDERCFMSRGRSTAAILQDILDLPSVTPTRPTGKWIHWTDDYKDYVTCSCCEYGEEGEVLLSDKTPFCPICGADMRESEGKK